MAGKATDSGGMSFTQKSRTKQIKGKGPDDRREREREKKKDRRPPSHRPPPPGKRVPGLIWNRHQAAGRDGTELGSAILHWR
ncbi:hypothetical protein CDAR_34721 [Caerostris darwini]|uniref:Uncharacterized protein n=1 Tax=Caerostris darwini TaxID=1538125 RepID=A0AAV4RV72_9ARAC|nr:hypothetical protein CDAR_34721 [Caerostris darwini]